jgi:hypothetical protein
MPPKTMAPNHFFEINLHGNQNQISRIIRKNDRKYNNRRIVVDILSVAISTV